MAAQEPGPQWLRIEDFSPGCYSYGGVVAGNNADRQLAAPIGSADAANTWSCYSIPSKALAALPGVTQTYTWPTTSGDTNYVVGCLIHDELSDGTTEAILICQYQSGSTSNWAAYSYILESGSTHTIASVSYTNASAGIFGSPYPAMTRANTTSSNSITGMTTGTNYTTITVGGSYTVGQDIYFTTLPNGVSGLALGYPYIVTGTGSGTVSIGVTTTGTWSSGGEISSVGTTTPHPVVVFPGPSTETSGSLWFYPNPNTPTSYTGQNLVSGSTQPTGQIVCHNGRVVVFAGSDYDWPSGGGFNTNENVYYTDPPFSDLYASSSTQATIFSPENPYGYGVAGSISAGELFVVKKRGGGLIVTGDLINPSVTVLPGVASTGNIIGQGASTTSGFIYCSLDAGCWSWNGSNTSQKMSTALDDGFFLPPEYDTMLSNNYGFFVSSFRQKVYVSNNWMMDTSSGAWWTYYPRKSQGGADLYYTQTVNGNYLYATQLSFPSSDKTFMYRFDYKVAAQEFQWQSLPLHLAPMNQVVDVRQIIVRASCPNENVEIAVSVIDNGQVVAGPFTQTGFVSDGPELIRYNIGAISLYEPSIRITVTNPLPDTTIDMPVIHGIDMQYNISNHLPSAN